VQVPCLTVAANNGGWRTWLRGQLDQRRWRPADLVRAGKGSLESSQVTRWLRSDQAPSFESVRAVCAALGVPVVEGLLAAGLVSPAEVGATVVVESRPIEDLGDRTLVDELARRLARTANGSAVRGSDVPLEWSKVDAPSRQSEGKGSAKRA
jgi:transcriptional regulator with XRE-family HTH domain